MESRLGRMVVAVVAALPFMVIGVAHQAVATPATATPATATVQPTGTLPPVYCDRRVAVGDRTVHEGTRTEANNTPYTYVTFTVTGNGCGSAGSVDYFTVPGSATAGVDYLGVAGTLHFESGQTGPRWVTVRVVKDSSPGGSEVFQLYLHDASGRVTVDDAFGRATILNDDATCTPPWDWTPPPGQPDYHCSE